MCSLLIIGGNASARQIPRWPGRAQKRMLYRIWINLHQAQPVVAQHSALRRGIRGPSPVIAAA